MTTPFDPSPPAPPSRPCQLERVGLVWSPPWRAIDAVTRRVIASGNSREVCLELAQRRGYVEESPEARFRRESINRERPAPEPLPPPPPRTSPPSEPWPHGQTLGDLLERMKDLGANPKRT